MTARPRIALVSAANRTRGALADYLGEAGFEVHCCDELAIPISFSGIVLLSFEVRHEELQALIRSWLKRTTTQRIVVVTSQTSALDELRAGSRGRLFVFPPPAFGWDLVDALRATDPPRPRSA